MTTTATAEEILATLQKGYDLVKGGPARRLSRDDEIAHDLDLDSLEFIDLVSVMESEFPPEVVDAVVDQVPDLRTVGDLIDAFLAAAAAA